MILIPTLVGKMVINHKQVGKKHQVLKSVRNELECQERPLRRAMKTRGTSLEFSRNWKKAHDARAGWVRETAVQDRVREVIMGWVMQFYNPGLILLPVWSEVTRGMEVQFSSVWSISHVRLFATPWTVARQASLSITNSWSPPKPMPIESVMPSNHLILCHPLLLLPPIPPSIRVFSNESVLHIRQPKYWSFSFSISPSNEHPGLISFRMDRLDLLAVHGTLKSLLQHHSSKASILWHSAFFIIQLSHPYMTTGKT